MDREELRGGSTRRVDAMVAAGARDEAARGRPAGASGPRGRRSASRAARRRRRGDEARAPRATRGASSPGCASWPGVELIDLTGRDAGDVAGEIVSALGETGA